MKEKFHIFGIKVSDKIAEFGGSWTFLISFTLFLVIWVVYNLISKHPFDNFPFILLNLMFSALAAYQAPIILMAANRQATKDREELDKDLVITEDTNERLKKLEEHLSNELNEIKKLLTR